MKKRTIQLQFPLAGLDRRRSYQSQPPYTCDEAQNVRPDDVFKRRQRGGSRPGLSKWEYDQLDSGSPVRGLWKVTWARQGVVQWVDNFSNIGSGWTVGSADDALPTVLTGEEGVSSSACYNAPLCVLPPELALIAMGQGALPQMQWFWIALSCAVFAWLVTCSGFEVHATKVGMDMTSVDISQGGSPVSILASQTIATGSGNDYAISLYITPVNGAFGGTYHIRCRMENNSPSVTTSGVEVKLALSDTGAYSGTIKDYHSSSLVSSDTLSTGNAGVKPGWFRVEVSNNAVSAYWLGNTLKSSFAASSGQGSQQSFGFSLEPDDEDVDELKVRKIEVAYKPSTAHEDHESQVVALSGGRLYSRPALGGFTAVSTSLRTATDRRIRATEIGQKLYIADNSDGIEGTDGATSSSPGTTLTSSSVGNWETAGVNANDFVVDITAGAGAALGTYQISSVSGTSLVLSTSPGNSLSSLTFRAIRATKVYNPSDGTLTILTSGAVANEVPVGCPLVETYLDRLVLAGDPDNPHQWNMSAAGNVTDWETGQTGAGKPVSGTSSQKTGVPGQPITALFAVGDDYLVISARRELYVLRGDPMQDGRLDNLSRSVGIVNADAWCRGADSEIYFLAENGLYMLPPGGLSAPQLMSHSRLPDELKNVQVSVAMEYDVNARGVHIFLVGGDNSKGQHDHWWWAQDTQSFWPVVFGAEDHEPQSLLQYGGDVLLGCRDGYVRWFDRYAETDDGTDIESHVEIGPIQHGGNYENRGSVQKLIGELAQNSGSVTWTIYTGNTSETVDTDTASSTGTWTAGMSRTVRPRSSGGAFRLRLSGTDSDRAWALEAVTAQLAQRGRLRV